MRKRYLYSCILLNLVFINRPPAQTIITDTAFYTSAVVHLVQIYTDSLKENLRLFNGYEFKGADQGVSGHPFFEYAEPQKGSVFYDGILYPNVLLSYDIIHDEIIFFNQGKNPTIQLNTQKINWFTIQKHFFINITRDANSVNFPGSGFYELLFEGAGTVLCKRKKQFDQSLKADEASKFIQWIWYYVKQDNNYYTVNNKHSLLAVCQDHKTELEKFIQKENLNFKKNPANTIIKVIDHYTQLKNK